MRRENKKKDRNTAQKTLSSSTTSSNNHRHSIGLVEQKYSKMYWEIQILEYMAKTGQILILNYIYTKVS